MSEQKVTRGHQPCENVLELSNVKELFGSLAPEQLDWKKDRPEGTYSSDGCNVFVLKDWR